MFTVDPSQIVRFARQGLEHIGDVSSEGSKGRFSLAVPRFLPIYIRGKFVDLSGATSGNATLSFKIDHARKSGVWDFTLLTIANVGTASGGEPNVHLRLQQDELYTWIADNGEYFVVEWTNPDPGKIRWALEVGLIDAALLRST